MLLNTLVTPELLTGEWSATFKSGSRLSGLALAGGKSPSDLGIVLVPDEMANCVIEQGTGSGLRNYTMINVAVTSGGLTAIVARTSCSGASFGPITLSKIAR